MTYEERIQNESQFRQGARGRKTFRQLYEDKNWKAGASNWGTPELFAARVICMPMRTFMAPLSQFYPNEFDFDDAHPNLLAFYVGYDNIDDLAWQSEPELVQATESSSLGAIWAALGALLRREQFGLNIFGPNQAPAGPSRPTRQAAIQAQESIQVIQMQAPAHRPQDSTGSTPQTTSDSRSPSLFASRSSSGSLLGYAEDMSRPLVEDATIRLTSSIVRNILNYHQDTTQARLLSWRDQRVAYGYRGGSRTVSAIDDGGIEVWLPGSQNLQQVALLEAKRSLRNVGGKPFVSDEVLARW
jgi:hypothetical protein